MSSNKKTLIDGDFQVGSDHFKVDTVNNYVGFNNATPQNTIDVQIGARTGTHSTGKPLYVTGVTSTSGAEFVSDDGTAGIGIGSSNIFTKGTNQNITIAPDGTGAVGIKTSTPNPSGETFDLWVQGDTKITGNVTVGTIIGDGSGLTNIISSQWDSSSEDIYFLNNSGSGSGRVAIGTSTPVSLLTLEGTSGGAPPTTGQEGTSNALVRVRDDNNVTLDIGTSSGTSWLQSSDATAMGTNYAISINPNGGNVGVGTISPNVPLEVSKSAGGEILRLATSTGTLYAGADADPPWFGTSSDDHLRLMTNGTEKVRIESGGNVGIGITSPGFSLDVDGDINFTGNLYEGGSLFVNTPWTIETSPDALNYTAGNVGIGGVNPSSTLEVTGNTYISSNLSVGGTLTINAITAAAFHSLQAVTDVGNVTSNTVQFSNATTGLVVDSNIVVTGNVTAAFLHGDASNVTAVPSAQITGTLAVANGGTGTTTSTGTGSVVLSDAPTFTGDVTFDTNTLFVDSVNDRVGVGTNSPDRNFHVLGTSRFDGEVEWYKVGERTSHANYGSNRDWYIRSGSTAGKVIIQDGGGNVGIGTTSPGSALDVVGDVEISGETVLGTATYRKRRDWNRNALAYVYLGNVTTNNTTGIRLDVSLNNSNTGYQMFNFQITLQGNDASHEGGKLVYSVQGTQNNSVSRAVDIGYVYVGSAGSFEYQLWLKDPTTATTGDMDAYLNCQGYYNFDTGVSDVAQGGAAPTNFQDGTVGVLVDSSGNVGVGVTNPLCKLDVAGAIYLRGETMGGIELDTISDASNRTNTFIAFGDAGTASDWAYLRQIGGVNDYTLALDLHDDGNEGGFVIRDITSTANPDAITTRFKVAQGGNVGIGTTAPTTALQISRNFTANGDTSAMISFENTGSGYYEWQIGPTVIDNAASFVIKGGADGFGNLSNIFVIKSTSVGIGVTSPSCKFDVADQNGSIENPMVVFRANVNGSSNGDGNVLRVANSGARTDAELYDATSNSVRQFSVKANGRCEAREFDIAGLAASGFLGGDAGASDGIFSRPDGQAYITVDDAFYFRDNADTTATRRGFMDTDNGNFKVTGGFTSSASLDYSEYFEWYDGNPDNEDRIGYSVSLFPGTDMIKKCEEGETPIGIVSGTSGFTGGGADIYWKGYWEQDAWGRPVYAQQLIHGEPVFNEDGTPKMKRVVNPDWDSTSTYTYIPRKDRKEWACVGLLGQVLMRPECIHSPFWTKMKSVDSEKDLWLISLFPSINKDVENDLEVEKVKTATLETQLASVLARLDTLESA